MSLPKIPRPSSSQEISHIAVLHVDFYIPDARSLKAKRMVLKSIKDKVRNKFNVSISEVDGQDKWQVATLAFAMIGTDNRYIDRTLQNLVAYLDHCHRVEVCDHDIDFL